MSHFAANCSSWWNPNEQQIPRSLSNNLSFKMESQAQPCHDAKHLGLQVRDQDSSSSQSTGQSHDEGAGMGGTNSQDRCISSESGQEINCGKRVEGQMKSVIFLGNPDLVFNPSQVDYSHSMPRIPYTYADPHFGGLFTAYGPQAIHQPHMAGITPARVPLPLDLSEDGPIFVNAKQYHGILRRRQSRAKLEAQNKLVKNRKPYLHESRHVHALKRVRGTGGRFLSTKKSQQPDPAPTTGSHGASDTVRSNQKGEKSEFGVHQSERNKIVSNNDGIFRQPDSRFSDISSRMGGTMQGNGGLMYGGSQHCAPVVR